MKQWKTKQNKELRSFLSRYPLLTFLSLIICCPTDIFYFFYCFTGLSYADIYDLTYDDIKPHFDNNLWIMKKRVKTNTDITVPFMDIPLFIIEKYRGKQKNNKVLPTMCNQKMNSYFKEIADLCGIEKHLTYQAGRHKEMFYQLLISRLRRSCFSTVNDLETSLVLRHA